MKSRNFLATQKETIENLIAKATMVLETPFLKAENSGDEVDIYTSEKERYDYLNFRMRNWSYLKKLKKALAKTSDHTYGECEDCGADISKQRLQARPTAELCISCKEEKEHWELGTVKSFTKTAQKVVNF